MSAERLQAAQDALHQVQAQAAALEELSEQLSLSVRMLEGEIAALAEELRSRPPAQDGDMPQGPMPDAPPEAPARSSDVDGARLVALDMALAGDPREVIDRYVAEHFDIPGRERLLDEVCAAAGG